MKKINNKGFMLAEIIIVSAIIMMTIVGVYKRFSNTHKIYAIRNSYYDSNVLYSLKNFENFLIDSMALNNATSGAYEIKKDGTPTSLFGSNQYAKTSLTNFFDTYAINKLYLVKYDNTNINKDDGIKNLSNVESDIQEFVKFYMKNLPNGEQYDKYDYIIIARTGVAAGNNSRQVAEKYGALRIATGTSTAPAPTNPTNPTPNDPNINESNNLYMLTSTSGRPDVYELNIGSNRWNSMPTDGLANPASPVSLTANGSKLYMLTNTGGWPNVYELNIGSNRWNSMPREGLANPASPVSLTANGSKLYMLTSTGGRPIVYELNIGSNRWNQMPTNGLAYPASPVSLTISK